MNEVRRERGPDEPASAPDSSFTPLPGEPGIPDVAQRPTVQVSRKGLFAVAFLILTLIIVSAVAIQRLVAGSAKGDDAIRNLADRPAAATAEPRRLDISPPAPAQSSTPRIPAIVPTPEELAEPIGVQRKNSQPAGQGSPPKSAPPEDAPPVLVSSRPVADADRSKEADRNEKQAAVDGGGALGDARRNLERYQQQLQGILDNLNRGGTASSPTLGPRPGSLISRTNTPAAAGDLLGGQLPSSSTPLAIARTMAARSLTLPKGTTFTCALKTRVVSATSGFVGCQVQRNVFGDDGRVLLIERGSHLDGEYRITSIRPGTVRIPVLWTRIRTPHGVTVDLDSPGTGPLGESGIDGYVDNRWPERIGAALLLSVIDDSVKLLIQTQSDANVSGTIVLPSTTSTTSKLAEKVLDSTINIPPLIYQNQGGVVGIYVARDVDFSSVYELEPTRP